MHRSVVAFRQIILWPLSAVLYFRSCNIDFKVQLSPNKTSPQDIMPTPLMKLCKDEMSSVICHLANISFTSGHFPTSLRTGLVTPLLKKPGLDVNDYKNYRAVTNLSTFSKILERLARDSGLTSLLLRTTAHCSQPTVNCTQRRLLL